MQSIIPEWSSWCVCLHDAAYAEWLEIVLKSMANFKISLATPYLGSGPVCHPMSQKHGHTTDCSAVCHDLHRGSFSGAFFIFT